jgi:hypothetical protein
LDDGSTISRDLPSTGSTTVLDPNETGISALEKQIRLAKKGRV